MTISYSLNRFLSNSNYRHIVPNWQRKRVRIWRCDSPISLSEATPVQSTQLDGRRVTLTRGLGDLGDQSEASQKCDSHNRGCGDVDKPELAEAYPHLHSPNQVFHPGESQSCPKSARILSICSRTSFRRCGSSSGYLSSAINKRSFSL